MCCSELFFLRVGLLLRPCKSNLLLHFSVLHFFVVILSEKLLIIDETIGNSLYGSAMCNRNDDGTDKSD